MAGETVTTLEALAILGVKRSTFGTIAKKRLERVERGVYTKHSVEVEAARRSKGGRRSKDDAHNPTFTQAGRQVALTFDRFPADPAVQDEFFCGCGCGAMRNELTRVSGDPFATAKCCRSFHGVQTSQESRDDELAEAAAAA